MSLDPNDPDVRVAVFGKQVEDFLQSDIGDYLIKRSQAQAEEALEELKRVWPWRRRRIQQLQNRIKVAEDFQLWLGYAVASGHQSMTRIEGEEHG